MTRLLSKRVIASFLLLLLVLFLLRPGAGWMRTRVSNSLSQGLGREVQIGSVRLRFLPRPGFELDDLLVRDNPAFGAEPLLRAPEVDAALSLGALLRGRMEIARLSLNGPSLNLTRKSDGKWNLEDLIDRTSHTSLAPTGSTRGITRPSFPYIEASDARVNLKLGAEKTHFALTNAEFALWQDSENTWGARLQARPIRTDANLTDTGVINVDGLWRRSAEVHQTPIQIRFQWKQAQIGQVSKLVYGAEKDWRGAALISGSILGTPARLRIVADASVDDFRHEDVIGGGNIRLAAHCTAVYAPATREIDDLDCYGPVGGGSLQAKGGASGILLDGKPFATSDLWFVADHAPAASLMNLLRHSRSDFPNDLAITGDVSSTIHVTREDLEHPVSIQGTGSVDDLRITPADKDPATFGTVPFKVGNGINVESPEEEAQSSSAGGVRRRTFNRRALPPGELRAELGPIDLSSGKLGTLTLEAMLTRTGFTGAAHGNTDLGGLLQIAKALNIPAPAIAAEGGASVSLHVSGNWFGRQKPLVTGTAHLHSVRARVRGLNAPIAVQSADLTVDANTVMVQNLSASAAGAIWHGSLVVPRPCAKPSECELRFRLRTDKLNAGALNVLLNPAARPKAWYGFLSLRRDRPSYLLQARASGKVAIDNLALGSASCTHFASDLRLDAGKVALSDFKAECFEGAASGSWTADFTAKPPKYLGSGSFERISLGAVARLTPSSWVEGSGSTNYEFRAAGSGIQDLLTSADINAQFKIFGGKFPNIVLTRNSGPLRASDFSGVLHLADRSLSFREAKLINGREVYTVSGTASLAGALNLKIVTENAGYAIGGTYVKTRVSTIPNAEASLKP